MLNSNHREVVLDLKTTGFDYGGENPDRIIEIGAVELIDWVPRDEFHRLVNPNGVVVSETIAKFTGLTNEKLEGLPCFGDPTVVDEFICFLGDSCVVAHNASLDRTFLNSELERVARNVIPEERWIDTLELARQQFPTSMNSLSKLCERFEISRTGSWEKQGGLIDSRLLVKVYQGLMDRTAPELDTKQMNDGESPRSLKPESERLLPTALILTADERDRHKNFLRETFGDRCIWSRYF